MQPSQFEICLCRDRHFLPSPPPPQGEKLAPRALDYEGPAAAVDRELDACSQHEADGSVSDTAGDPPPGAATAVVPAVVPAQDPRPPAAAVDREPDPCSQHEADGSDTAGDPPPGATTVVVHAPDPRPPAAPVDRELDPCSQHEAEGSDTAGDPPPGAATVVVPASDPRPPAAAVDRELDPCSQHEAEGSDTAGDPTPGAATVVHEFIATLTRVSVRCLYHTSSEHHLSVINKMRCNACWRELEAQAISTTCGHLLCTDDAKKILSMDGACPICDQVLSKSHMKPIDVSPSDEWTNMAMTGISPQILMKSAYRSIMFYIGQKELEMQYKMNRLVGQCRQKCEHMQAKFTEKLEEVHAAYQKMGKRCQLMEQEIENLRRDKEELQEKLAEKCRQKRKLDEMYDQLRNEYESVKRSAIQPVNNYFSRPQPDLFSGMLNMMDGSGPLRQGSIHPPETPGRRGEGWTAQPRQRGDNSGLFDLSGGSPAHTAARPPRHPARSVSGANMNNSSAALRNMIISPVKRPQLSRYRPQMFQ